MAMTIVIKARQKKKVPIVIDHSSSCQKKKSRIVLFMFERGQKCGLVFTPSKKKKYIEAKEI